VVMTDMMVDVETTGTNPEFAAVMQIAAIKFNHGTEEIGPTFNRALALAPNRFWDDDTKSWWMRQKRSVFDGIVARMEDPRAVTEAFYRYALEDAPPGGYRFWAKPTSFDWPMIAGYMRQYALPMPFHYRQARDVNTYIAACMDNGVEHKELEHITAPGDAHNALHDCVLQLKKVFAAKNKLWGEVLP